MGEANWVGQLVFDLKGKPQCLRFESLLEYQAALCLIYRRDVADIEEQIAPVVYKRRNGKVTSHYLDFRVTLVQGRRIGIAVKPKAIAMILDFQSDIRAIRSAAVPHVVHDLCVVTERNIHPVTLHNAKLFHAARRPQVEVDTIILEAANSSDEPSTIREFLGQTGLKGAGFHGVARGIRSGAIVHVDGGRITGDSLIRGGEVA
ncbi:hypothetical protein [Limimaricola soesokkakensis]|uniref:hypothetical protein n=1 Tax=Limimaricola soesokkakensis TaxID=1343159 RepID=UPI0035193D7E